MSSVAIAVSPNISGAEDSTREDSEDAPQLYAEPLEDYAAIFNVPVTPTDVDWDDLQKDKDTSWDPTDFNKISVVTPGLQEAPPPDLDHSFDVNFNFPPSFEYHEKDHHDEDEDEDEDEDDDDDDEEPVPQEDRATDENLFPPSFQFDEQDEDLDEEEPVPPEERPSTPIPMTPESSQGSAVNLDIIKAATEEPILGKNDDEASLISDVFEELMNEDLKTPTKSDDNSVDDTASVTVPPSEDAPDVPTVTEESIKDKADHSSKGGLASRLMSRVGAKSPILSGPILSSPVLSRPKSPIRSRSGGKSPMWGRSGGKSPILGRSGAKSPILGRSKSPAWSRSKSPAWSRSGAKSPTLNRSGAKSPLLSRVGAKSPLSFLGVRKNRGNNNAEPKNKKPSIVEIKKKAKLKQDAAMASKRKSEKDKIYAKGDPNFLLIDEVDDEDDDIVTPSCRREIRYFAIKRRRTRTEEEASFLEDFTDVFFTCSYFFKCLSDSAMEGCENENQVEQDEQEMLREEEDDDDESIASSVSY